MKINKINKIKIHKITKSKGTTLAELLVYIVIFSLFTIFTLYTFQMISKTYRTLLAKNEELVNLQKATQRLVLTLSSSPPRDGTTAPYTLIMSPRWKINNSTSRRVQFIRYNNNRYVNVFLYFEGTPQTSPFNDGRLCEEVRDLSNNLISRRIVLKNLEDVRFQVMNNGYIQSSASGDLTGDNVLAIIYIQETKYNKKLVSSFIVSGQ
jgi:type II secretory pathway component PulJ